MKRFLKIAGIIVGAFFAVYLLSFALSFGSAHPETGLSFSEFYAKEGLGLDWRAAYESILSDLNPKNLILMAYWQYLEPEVGKFDFADLDWEINLASDGGRNVVLVIGERVPRWPECHIPSWAGSLNESSFKSEFFNYLTTIIEHYKSFPAIKAWQVENEPYLSSFGMCPPLDKNLFDEEIALVKKLDPTRPIVLTDSGELSTWFGVSRSGDVLGSTLYRVVSAPYIGVFHYFFIPPAFYTFRAALVEKLFHVSRVMISELQAEPWSIDGAPLRYESMTAQTSDFSTTTLLGNFKFAERTGLDPIYLWGSEWWYYRKINGDPSFWNLGKQILSE